MGSRAWIWGKGDALEGCGNGPGTIHATTTNTRGISLTSPAIQCTSYADAIGATSRLPVFAETSEEALDIVAMAVERGSQRGCSGFDFHCSGGESRAELGSNNPVTPLLPQPTQSSSSTNGNGHNARALLLPRCNNSDHAAETLSSSLHSLPDGSRHRPTATRMEGIGRAEM